MTLQAAAQIQPSLHQNGDQQRREQPDAVALGRRALAALEVRRGGAQDAEHDGDADRAAKNSVSWSSAFQRRDRP